MFPPKLLTIRNLIAAALLALLLTANQSTIPAPTGTYRAQPTANQQAASRLAGSPETPIHAELTINTYPAPSKPAHLTCTVTTIEDAPGTTAQIDLPKDAHLIDGNLTWEGDLLTNTPVTLEATVAFDSPGDQSVFCRAHHEVSEDESWGDLAELYFHVEATGSGEGFAPLSDEQRAASAAAAVEMVSPGDGQLVEGGEAILPELSGSPDVLPGSLEHVLPEATTKSELNDTTLGELTITGHWYFYNRADALNGTPSLVQIVRGDNDGHLAWCYISSNDGYYSCGPFANPGSAGVKSRWRSWVNWTNDGVLSVVNPDVGTTSDLYNAYWVDSGVSTFTDGTHDMGSWAVINGNNLERPFWVLADMNAADNYLYYNGGGQPGGQVIVQWKIDSTDGDYYMPGGNVHLTGTAPLSTSTAIHEYGHNVMYNVYGNWLPTNDCPSPHYINWVSGTTCAWTEGWSDFLPMAVTGDPYYRWDDGSSINLELPTWGTYNWSNGDQVEGRVAGALWDILDTNVDGDDLYSDGSVYHIWNIIYNVNNSTFAQFWSSWLSYAYNNSSAGPIMDIYQNTINYRLGPTNDDFSGRWNLPIPSRQTESTVNATTQAIDPNTACGSTSPQRQSRSVWFYFTPSITSNFEFDTLSSNYDTVLSIWTGSPGSFTYQGCNDDYNGTAQSLVNQPLTAGVTYYIEALSYGDSGGGNLSLLACISPAVPTLSSPANGTRTTDNTPTFSWGAVPNANYYQIQIARDTGFTDFVVNGYVTSSSWTSSVLPDGWYYWRIRSNYYSSPCDSYSAWTSYRSLQVDTTPPSGSVSINSGAAYANSTSVSLSISAADSGGLNQMRFSNDNSTWSTWETIASNKNWTLASGDGTKTVYAQYSDMTGNVASFSDTIVLDTAPPTGSISINSNAPYTNSTSVSLGLSATDALSGVSQMRFSNDNSSWSTWESYAATKSWTLTSGDGGKTVYVQFRDGATNGSSSFSDAIVLDTTAPSGTITINGGATATVSINVTLTLSASDPGGSGVSQMRFSNNGSTWSTPEAYATSKAWTLASGDGIKTVYVQFSDNAANSTGNFTDTILLDTTAPSGTITINAGAAYANSTGVTLTLSATDGGAGMSQMRFSSDGSGWTSWETYATTRAWTLTGGDGTKTVYVQYSDLAGNVSSSFTDTIMLDTAPPTGSISINGNAPFTNSTAVSLSLTATDSLSGVSQMRFSNDSSTWSTWEAYATSKSWTMAAGDGSKMVYAQFRDEASNGSSSFSDTILLDTSPPTGTININGGAAATNSTSVTLSLSASDPASGINQMRFSNNGTTWSGWEAYAVSKAWTLTGGDENKTVYVQYSDSAGNTSGSITDTILLDTTSPTGSISINAGSTYTNSTGVTLTLSATDSGSGVSQMRFSTDGSSWTSWETYATSKAWTLTGGDGTRYVYAQFNDLAGNVTSSLNDSIILDTASPTGTISINSGDSWTNGTSVTLTLSATDSLSGVSQMRFSNDNSTWSTWESYATSKSWTISAGDGAKTVYAQFRDNALNVSANATDTIGLDTTLPTGTVNINAGAAATNSTSVTLTLSASDSGGSGVFQMRFSNDGSSWSPPEAYATSKTWTLAGGDGINTVYVQFNDNAGNVTGSITDTILVDTTAPTGTITINSGADYTISTGVTLTLSATDSGVGVSQMRFSNNNTTWSAWEPYGTSKAWTLASGDGHKIVYVQYQDVVGNVTPSLSDEISLDASGPSGSVMIDSGAEYTNSTSLDLTLSAMDAGSNVSQMRFSTDNVNWTPWEDFAASKSVTIGPANGTRQVYVQYRDQNGNGSPSFSDSIILDTVAPSSKASSPHFASGVAFSVTWSGTDATSPIVAYDVQYRVDDGIWSDWLTGVTSLSAVFGSGSPVTIENGHSYYFRVRAWDAAGNLEDWPTNVDGDSITTTVNNQVFMPYIRK